jgi:FAD:protein FMN transferase
MKLYVSLCLLVSVAELLASPAGTDHSLTFERGLMGTRFAITCYHSDQAQAKAAAEAAFIVAQQINDAASDYVVDSELLSLSKHPPAKPITVSPLLFPLISQARVLAEKTKGYFDPTLGPVTKLWRESRRRNSLPDGITLSKARAATGWQNLIIDPLTSTITFKHSGMRLDLGGIAKGQAADAMLTVMTNHGIPRTCITAGGDVRLGDPPPSTEGWKIAVHTVSEVDSQFLTLANCAVSTSGDLHQYLEINSIRYSHIIDPSTGLGLTRRFAATVVAPTAAVSDALATACCTTPPRQARAMALSAGATEVYLTP